MFYAGLDPGKRLDYSALAVVEGAQPEGRELAVRYLERIELGTPYTDVVRRTAELMARLGRCRLVVDATGVGMPVVDMLRGAKPALDMTAVMITSGAEQRLSDGVWHVPKVDLLAGVQAALEAGELRIARGMKETGTLVRELTDVRARVRGRGRLRLGADGRGQHDDLVVAVALACWAARKESPRG